MTDLISRLGLLRTAIPPALVVWTLLMLALTLLPSGSLPEARVFSYDKIGHFLLFGGWTFILGLYFIIYRQETDTNLIFLLLAGILLGGLIEILQYILPANRTASWGDVMANSLGCITAYFMLNPIKDYLSREKESLTSKN